MQGSTVSMGKGKGGERSLVALCHVSPHWFLCFCISIFVSASVSAKDLFDMTLQELAQVRVASHFLEDEQSVGSSVSIVNEKQWRERGAEKTLEAIEHVPGVYLSEYFHGMIVPTFRGIARPDQYNSFLMLLDGMPLNAYTSASPVYGTPNFSLGNLASIEVIRGPGSALYGADAFNGVISLNTWVADSNQYEVWGDIGSYGYRQATGRIRHGFNEEMSITSALSFTAVDDLEIEDNFHSSASAPLTESEISGEYSNVTTSHKIQLSQFELGMYYSKHDVDDSYGIGEIAGFPNGNHSDGLAEMKAVKLSHIANLPGEWQLDSKVFYVEQELFGSFGFSNTGAPPVSTTFDWDSKDERTGVNILAKRPMNEQQIQLLFGYSYDYMKAERLMVDLENSAPAVEGESREVNALLAQIEKRYMQNRLQFIIGGRFDHYSDFGNYFSPRIAVIYHPIEKSALKFLYGNSFRAPSINEQFDNVLVKGGGEELDPEQVDTFEIIWMHAGDRWRYGVNSYYSEISDTIVLSQSTDPDFLFQYSNVGEFKSYGIELDGSYRIDNWEFSGNIGHNSFKSITNIDNDDAGDVYPDVIANLQIKYSTDNSLTYAISQVYQNGRRTPGSSILTPSFVNEDLSHLSRTDLHIGWPFHPSYECYLNVRDLFDGEDTRTAMVYMENGAATPGRRINIGFKANFN